MLSLIRQEHQVQAMLPNLRPAPASSSPALRVQKPCSGSLPVQVWDKKGTVESLMSFKALKGALQMLNLWSMVLVNLFCSAAALGIRQCLHELAGRYVEVHHPMQFDLCLRESSTLCRQAGKAGADRAREDQHQGCCAQQAAEGRLGPAGAAAQLLHLLCCSRWDMSALDTAALGTSS